MHFCTGSNFSTTRGQAPKQAHSITDMRRLCPGSVDAVGEAPRSSSRSARSSIPFRQANISAVRPVDASLARAGINPPINLQLSGTRRAEMLLDAAQLEGLKLVRGMLNSTRSATAVPQLLSLMDKAETNDALLMKIKDWVALMEKSR